MPKNMARPNVGKLTLRTHLRPFLEKSGSRQIPAESPARFSQVSAEAAHDLNNALGSIRLCLDLLEAESDNAPKVRQHLKHIKPAVEHATDLTRHMLGLNAPAVSPGTETSLNTVLEGMGPMLSTLPRRDVALRLRLSPGLAPIAIDPTQVIRIVLNLVLNACEAMPQGGEVMIETTNWRVEEPGLRHKAALEIPEKGAGLRPAGRKEDKGAGWVMLRVRDTGRGMSAATRARAFQPFFTTKVGNPHPAASGLGLSSVLRMVQNAGGTIQIESVPGKGSDIAMLFPGRSLRKPARKGAVRDLRKKPLNSEPF